MKDRGLVVIDKEFALARLSDLNIYQLCGYWLTLERDDALIEGSKF